LGGLAIAQLAGRLRLRPTLGLALALVLPAVLAPLSLAQTGLWRDSVAFWSFARARYPMQPEMCRNLGVAQAHAGRPAVGLGTLESCAAVQHNRAYYLYDMTLAARDARDGPRFHRLLAELVATQPEHPFARHLRAPTSSAQKAP